MLCILWLRGLAVWLKRVTLTLMANAVGGEQFEHRLAYIPARSSILT